jgi:hypothetical protein
LLCSGKAAEESQFGTELVGEETTVD